MRRTTSPITSFTMARLALFVLLSASCTIEAESTCLAIRVQTIRLIINPELLLMNCAGFPRDKSDRVLSKGMQLAEMTASPSERLETPLLVTLS
jgi:hypothetical protein